jgi:hypothetical protein
MKVGSLRSFTFAIVASVSLCLACCRPPPLMSYPWFWDYTKPKPSDADVVATYKVLKLRIPDDLARSVQERSPSITLKADHTVVLSDFPQFDGFGDKVECRLSGTANWELDKDYADGLGWSIEFQHFHSAARQNQPDCYHGDMTWGILILGGHPPYRLYDMVGDPDSDTGIEYQKAGP